MEKKLPLLEIKNLRKKYSKKGPQVLKDINLQVFPGTIHAFVGSNGAGKTTTFKCIVDAYKHFEGEILIGGHPNYTPEAKKNIAYLPELPTTPKKFKVKSYLYSIGLLLNLKKQEIKDWVNKVIKNLGLEMLQKSKTANLSSGQKRKVFIAQSLISNPKIYILDEPTANLDPKAREDFYQFVMEEKQQGKAIFISTHILDEIDKYADYVTIIEEGTILYSGPKTEHNLKEQYFGSLKKS